MFVILKPMLYDYWLFVTALYIWWFVHIFHHVYLKIVDTANLFTSHHLYVLGTILLNYAVEKRSAIKETRSVVKVSQKFGFDHCTLASISFNSFFSLYVTFTYCYLYSRSWDLFRKRKSKVNCFNSRTVNGRSNSGIRTLFFLMLFL